jgi:hypothetical protein
VRASAPFGRRAASLALAITLALGACSGDGDKDSEGLTGDAVTGDDLVQSELMCVAQGYPCSWAEATPEAFDRTQVILTIAAGMLSHGESIDSIAESIAKAPDVVAVSSDGLGLMFRVEGGAPAMVESGDVSSEQLLSGAAQATPDQAILDAQPALAPAGAFTGCPPAQDDGDGRLGVTKTAGEGKNALLLSPWQFGLPWDVGTIRRLLELPRSKYLREYGGSVTSRSTSTAGGSVLQPSQTNVVPADFCGWEKYDTIVLMTHGRALCEKFDTDGTPVGCLTSFSVGQYSETAEQLKELVGGATGVTISVAHYGTFRDDLTDAQLEACHDEVEHVVLSTTPGSVCFQALPAPSVSVKVTSDFFRENYPNGLKDRIIFLAACQGMKFGDMGTILGVGQGRGQILGFSKVARLDHAQLLLELLAIRLAHGERIGAKYKVEANQYLDDQGANADLYNWFLSEVPGGELGDLLDAEADGIWGSDVVAIYHDGDELMNGGIVGLADPAPSTSADALLLTLRIKDVEEDETPEQFNVSVLWNDQPVELEDVSWFHGDRSSYSANVTVKLPRKLEEGEEFDLEIRGELPAANGGPTLWNYTEVTAESADACEQLKAVDVSAALGVQMEAIDVGDFGSFLGGFCGWRTPADDSQLSLLIVAGGATGFRADFAGSSLAVNDFGDVAVYDPSTGRGDDCSSITDNSTGTFQWVCFVNLNVAFGDDALYFTLEGNVVGDNGTEGALNRLRDLVAALRE